MRLQFTSFNELNLNNSYYLIVKIIALLVKSVTYVSNVNNTNDYYNLSIIINLKLLLNFNNN